MAVLSTVFIVPLTTSLVLISGIAAHLPGGRHDQLCDYYHSAVGLAVFAGGQRKQLITVFRRNPGVIQGQFLALRKEGGKGRFILGIDKVVIFESILGVGHRLEHSHDLILAESGQGLDDSLVLIEDENRFNPIADMLNTVRHDGTDRLAELAEIAGIAEDETACLYLRKWLHQSVAMALNDDTDPYGADGVLVIQNPQGAGKTLLFSKLALYADWFAEGISIDLDKKDSVIQATGCWIAELGELDSTLKREQLSLKAFITSRTDTYRQPYARAATRKPRRTSFCATVNPTEFLNDETGSRRWWVIRPSRIDVERLKGLSREWVCQLWAQVYSQLYLPNPQGFRLTEDERKKLTADNEQFSKPLPGETEILDKLEWESPVKQAGL